MPRRGSLTCRSITFATISRTRTLIRRVLASSATVIPSSVVAGVQLPPRAQQLDLGAPRNEPFAFVEHVPAVRRICSDNRHANRRPPMKIQRTGLRRGHLKPPPQLRHNRPHHTPLLLERVRISEQQIQLQRPDKHLYLRTS